MNKVFVDGKVFLVDGNTVNGNNLVFDILKIDERFQHILHQGKGYNVEICSVDMNTKTIILKVNNTIFTTQVKNKFDQLLEQMGFDNTGNTKISELKAPMPGMVIDIRVKVGDVLLKGDVLLVLEAMKMENVLKASADVTIKSIEAIKGKSVEKNQVLMIFN